MPLIPRKHVEFSYILSCISNMFQMSPIQHPMTNGTEKLRIKIRNQSNTKPIPLFRVELHWVKDGSVMDNWTRSGGNLLTNLQIGINESYKWLWCFDRGVHKQSKSSNWWRSALHGPLITDAWEDGICCQSGRVNQCADWSRCKQTLRRLGPGGGCRSGRVLAATWGAFTRPDL
jgi:hypothetical protein